MRADGAHHDLALEGLYILCAQRVTPDKARIVNMVRRNNKVLAHAEFPNKVSEDGNIAVLIRKMSLLDRLRLRMYNRENLISTSYLYYSERRITL